MDDTMNVKCNIILRSNNQIITMQRRKKFVRTNILCSVEECWRCTTRTIPTLALQVTDCLHVKKYNSFSLGVVVFATSILPYKRETWDLETLTLVNIRIVTFCYMTPCSLKDACQCFRGTSIFKVKKKQQVLSIYWHEDESSRFLCNSGTYLPIYLPECKCHIPDVCYLKTGNSSYKRNSGSLSKVAWVTHII